MSASVTGDDLFVGGDPVATAMAAQDWSATTVGAPDGWPASLRQVVALMLASRFPMWMGWGPELAFFYNDAYRRDTLQSKHPWAIGRPAREVWAEIWDDIGPRIASVLETGVATWDEGLLLFLDRAGYHEETYHTFSYSPLRDGTGVPGFLCVVSEDTERVLGERRLRVLSELGDISAVTAPTAEQACEAAVRVLADHRRDMPFASIYLLDESRAAARRVAFHGLVDDPAIVPRELDRAGAADATLWSMLASGVPQVVTGLAERYPGLLLPMPEPLDPRAPTDVLAVPLAGGGGGGPVGVLFAGISPFRALDDEYRRFVELVAGQVATSVADAEAYQAQLRRAEELAALDRAKTEFFANVSHELRTPLTLIAGPAEDGLADETAPLPAAQRTRMEVIARNSGRLRRLVDTMLEFARLEAGRAVPRREAVDLGAVTRGVAESFAPAVLRAGLGFAIDCRPLPSAVSVDVDMWEKIVLNLLSNAVKYTLEGQVQIALGEAADGGVRLAVSDTGIGIPADELPRLFERFHRVQGVAGRSHEGSGIGLALVQELAALHGGTVAAESAPGTGSTFVVTLPPAALSTAVPVAAPATTAVALYRDEALQWSASANDDADAAVPGPITPTPAGAAPLTAGSTSGARVLVVEDNRDLREFLARLLAPHYTVAVAEDGIAAVAAVREQRPDLVLTDVMMPRMDGFGLITALRADPATATTPVIMLSARAGEEAAIEGLEAGADDYLVKPFSSHDLLARVRSNLEMARLRNHEGAWRAALVNALQDGLYVVDPTGSVIEINEAFTDILGYGPDALPVPAPHPWWPDPDADPHGHAAAADAMRSIQQNGSGHFVLPLFCRDGRRIWASCTASTLPDPATDEPVIVGVVRDVTAEYRAGVRDRLLADAGELLAGPGALAERLDGLARLATPALGDLTVISLAEADGSLRHLAAAHRTDPEQARRVLAMPTRRIRPSDADRYRQSAAFVLDPLPDRVLTGDPDDGADGPVVDVRAALVVPLVAGDRLLGAVAFAAAPDTAPWPPDEGDVRTAEELGRRIAAAVEADRIAVREQQLHSITAELAAAATAAQVAEILAASAATVFRASGVAVHAADPDDPDRLRLAHRRGELPEALLVPHLPAAADVATSRAGRTRLPEWHPGSGDAGAVAALPLVAGPGLAGTVTMIFDTERAFLPDERSFAMALVGQAALALDRATISDVRAEIATTLQLGLLPARLPRLPGVALHAQYVPAGTYTSAGGDWYDVTVLDDDHIAITVGDVVGHGSRAAAVMGQLRAALAAYLLQSRAPAHALQMLSRFAEQVDGAIGSTAMCLVLNTVTGHVRWARAGHLPPLVLALNGPARFLPEAQGTILGLTAAPDIAECEDRLGAGDAVLLFTDGLVERRGEDLDTGLARLAAIVAAHAGLPADRLLPAVLDAAMAGSGTPDDVAVVLARMAPPPLAGARLAVPPQLAVVRREVSRWAEQAALPVDQADDLQLALGEALSNSVEHAYAVESSGGPVPMMRYHLAMRADGGVDVDTGDDGAWRIPPADPGYRGHGLRTIRALTERLSVEHDAVGTRLRFTVPAQRTEGGPAAGGAAHAAGPTRLRTRLESGVLVVELSGELDLQSVPELRPGLLDAVAAAPGAVEIDLRDVGHLASAGVALLLDAGRVAGRPPRLRATERGSVARVLGLAGLLPTPTPDSPAGR